MIKIKITYKKFSSDQILKISKAASVLERCFNSDDFMNFCMANVYNFTQTTDKGFEVYSKIMTGIEKLNTEHDNEADIFLELDNRNGKGVIGYTYPSTVWQYIYGSFFNTAPIHEIAGNLAHEYMHKIGYGHDFKKTKRRSSSVPYKVGYFVRDWCKKNPN